MTVIYSTTADTPGAAVTTGQTFNQNEGDAIYALGTGNSSALVGNGSNTFNLSGALHSRFHAALRSTVGNHTVTISETGTLFGAIGISFSGGNNAITNHGSLDAVGDTSPAIEIFGGSNTLVNTGAIRSAFAGVYVAGLGNSLTNSGTIVSANNFGAVVLMGTISNSGTIRSDGFSAISLHDGGSPFIGSQVTNNGTIINTDPVGPIDFPTIRGYAGDDTIINNNLIRGDVLALALGGGADIYNGRNGRAIGEVLGEAGNDTLIGGAFVDVLRGGDDNDTLEGGGGADTLDGGFENDTYVLANQGNFADTIIDIDGIDMITTTISRALTPWNFIEGLTLVEGAGGIAGYGNGLNNTLIGNSSNNRLEGLNGGDTLVGLRGTDVLVGGADNDRFRFVSIQDSAVGGLRDVITDLDDSGEDIIDLSPIASLTTYVGQAGFNAPGQVRAVQSGVNVLIQMNAVGASGAESEVLLLNTTLGNGAGQFGADDLLF